MFFIVEMKRRSILAQSETRDGAQKLLTELLSIARKESHQHLVNYQIIEADSLEELEDDLAIY